MKPDILCIEDNPDNRTLIQRILRPDSYNLIEATSGVQGLAIAEGQECDLILLDINLPDIDGYEIARRIRASKNSTLAQIPIIAVTANAMKGDAQKAIQAGCTKYMSKPINIDELVKTVDVFARKGTQRGAA